MRVRFHVIALAPGGAPGAGDGGEEHRTPERPLACPSPLANRVSRAAAARSFRAPRAARQAREGCGDESAYSVGRVRSRGVARKAREAIYPIPSRLGGRRVGGGEL